MAKMEQTRVTLVLDPDAKRALKALTAAVNKLSRNLATYKVDSALTDDYDPSGFDGDSIRLVEQALDVVESEHEGVLHD